MASIDQQFIEYIVKTLVNNPDKVQIDRVIDEKGVLLNLTVDKEDVGRVIGRRGATAQSLRTLLRALGTKNDARYNLKIVNDDEEGGGSSADSEGADEKPAPKAKKEKKADKEEVAEAPATTEADDSFVSEEVVSAEEDKGSELAEKTRAELAELDDLEV